jgi:hypothetical protein
MGNYKFYFLVRLYFEPGTKPDSVELDDIFGNYVSAELMSYPKLSAFPELYLETREVTAKQHLSQLSKWGKAFRKLYYEGWNGDGDFVWMFIPVSDRLMREKLKSFFANHRKPMEDLAETHGRHLRGLFKIVVVYGETAQIEFSGLDISDIRWASHRLKIRILLIDAILDYCNSRSIEDIEEETWGDFRRSVRNGELREILPMESNY